MKKSILILLCAAAIIVGLIILILGLTYKSKAKIKTQRKIRRNRIITGVIIMVVGILLGLGIFYMYPKRIASEILSTQDPEKYSKLCDELFETTGSEGVVSDYLKMKAEKTIKEVQTLCGNYAKRILGKK